MDLLRYAVYIIGILAVFRLLYYGLIVKTLLNLRFKKGDCELRHVSEVPSYLRQLFDPYERQLVELGFHFSHAQMTDEAAVSEHSRKWGLVYFNSAEVCYATVSVSPIPEADAPAQVEFASIFSDGQKLVTVNGIAHDTVGEIPNVILVDAYAETLEKQLQAHLGELAKLREDKTPIFKEPCDVVADEKKTAEDYIDSLEACGLAKRTDGHCYRLGFVAVLRHALKFAKGQRRLRALQVKRRRVSEAQRQARIEAPIEVEVEAFLKVRETTEAKKTGYVGKGVVLLVSLLVFILAFKISFSMEIILLFVVALFIHELGHVLGMRLFGYKDLQVIFIPFLGAAALGGRREATALQRVVVYLLGPTLGMVVGTICLLAGAAHEVRALMAFGGFSLILNYLNLVPIIPLDGGRVFELVVFSRVSFLKSAFLIASVGVMAVVGIGLWDPILIGLCVFLGLGTWPQILQNRALSQLRKRIKAENLELDDESIIPIIFRMLREKPFSKLPFARKYAIARHVSDNVMQKLPTLRTSVLSLLMYVAVLILPIMMLLGSIVLSALWQIYIEANVGL